jgi:hypothetical protein
VVEELNRQRLAIQFICVTCLIDETCFVTPTNFKGAPDLKIEQKINIRDAVSK